MAEEETPEWAAQAEGFKTRGNELLAAKQYTEAVDMYTRAIELDPENAVYYSNRSAAYLAMGDSRGKALKDAEKCVELKPDWWKGYSRKGAAEHALLRFDAARATYNEGLKREPDNTSLLQASEEAYAAGQEHSRRLREQVKEKERLQKEAEQRQAEKEQEAERRRVQEQEKKKNEPKDEDALLAEFMSEVQEIEESANCIKKDVEEQKKEKPPVDFGTPDGQVERLLQPHFKWINLNPFRVLMLDVNATEEDMKQHYRKISTMVHPDKCRNAKAREAFEEVNKAYNLITQEDRRKVCIRTIENATQAVEKERRLKMKKGVKESELGGLKDAVEKAVLRAFAEIENRRVNIEQREAAQRRREAEQEEKEQKEVSNMFKRERTWAETDRREQRVGSWRSFVTGGKRRKEMDAHGWKEETRDDKKFGEADNETYKRGWK